jgi:hypothetical protein
MTFLGVAVPALLAWLGAILKSWTAKQKEATDRQALHMALETGALAAERKFGRAGPERAKIEYAVDYAQKSVPDAIENLKPSDDVLAKLVMAKQQTTEKPNA